MQTNAAAASYTPITSAGGWVIGQGAAIRPFFWNGYIDEPAIYNYALGPNQVLNHYVGSQ